MGSSYFIDFARWHVLLEAEHRCRGTRAAAEIAQRQARVAVELAEGYSQVEIAERNDFALRTLERDVEFLRQFVRPARRRAA